MLHRQEESTENTTSLIIRIVNILRILTIINLYQLLHDLSLNRLSKFPLEKGMDTGRCVNTEH